MSKEYLEIEADVNDADYINKKSLISEKQLEELKPIIKVIKKFEGKVKDYEEHLDNAQLDKLAEYLPFMENEKIHTIESIKVIIVEKEISLFEN